MKQLATWVLVKWMVLDTGDGDEATRKPSVLCALVKMIGERWKVKIFMVYKLATQILLNDMRDEQQIKWVYV